MSDSADPGSRTGRFVPGDGIYGDGEPEFVARSRQLNLIQLLGRRAAEARSPFDLFEITFSVLSDVEPLDFIGVAHELEDAPELLLYRGRPLSDDCVNSLLAATAGLLGAPVDRIRERWNELEGFDPLRSRRDELRREDLTVLPLLRRGQPAAYVLLVQAEPSHENRLPLWYNAVNQLTVHLDRVLGVREDEEDRFRSILESMPQAVLLIDGNLRILQMNRAATDLRAQLALPEDADGSAWFAHLGLDDGVEALLGGEIDILRDEVAGGEDRELNVTVTPLAGGDGPERGFVFVLSDVSETRRLQRELERSERLSSLGQMISGVAHELNNPLSTILGYAQLLGKKVDDEQTSRRLHTLEEEAHRCRRIVENLLSFARRRDPERKPASLNEVVGSVEALMRYQLRVENITLTSDLDPELPAILGDRHELQQVLVNLFTNARHSIAETGREGSIDVRTRVDTAGAIRLEIADTGVGVDDSVREKIFEPFFTTKAEGQGTGLGLSLVSGIVRSHGGTIEALPDQQTGATIRVTLPPLAAAERAAEPRAPETAVAAAARILVVDDDASLARVVCEALAEDGHFVRDAQDGHAALERFSSEAFDVIICDVRTPRMDALQLHRELQRIRPGDRWRLVLTSGDTVGERVRQLAASEGFEILQKPFSLDLLRSTVNRILPAQEKD